MLNSFGVQFLAHLFARGLGSSLYFLCAAAAAEKIKSAVCGVAKSVTKIETAGWMTGGSGFA